MLKQRKKSIALILILIFANSIYAKSEKKSEVSTLPNKDLIYIKDLLSQKDIAAAYNYAKKIVDSSASNDENIYKIFYHLVDIIANNKARHQGFSQAAIFLRQNLKSVRETSNLEYFLRKIAYLYAMNQDFVLASILCKNYLQNSKFTKYVPDMYFLLGHTLEAQGKYSLAKLAFTKIRDFSDYQHHVMVETRIAELSYKSKNEVKEPVDRQSVAKLFEALQN